MKECKYKLPCNWCDKFNKCCDMVEPIEIKLPDPNKCEHDWLTEQTYAYIDDNNNIQHVTLCVCRKCMTRERHIKTIDY